MSPRVCARGGCCALIDRSAPDQRTAIYCSDACYLLACYQKKQVARWAEREMRLALLAPSCQCGAPIRQPRKGVRRWCGRRCYERHRRAKKEAFCHRTSCGRVLPKGRSKFCSDRCCQIETERHRKAAGKRQGKPAQGEKCACGGDVRRDGSHYYCAQRCGWSEIRRRAA